MNKLKFPKKKYQLNPESHVAIKKAVT